MKLMAIIRLSTAHAKLKLRRQVLKSSVEAALQVLHFAIYHQELTEMEEREQEREKELGKNCSTDHDARSNALSRKCRSESDAESLSRACNEWRSKSSTVDIPFFLVTISSNSSVTLRNLRELEACQHNGQKKDSFFCYHENRGFADLGLSLIGEAEISFSQGGGSHENMPNVVGWELNKGKKVPSGSEAIETDDSPPGEISISSESATLSRHRNLQHVEQILVTYVESVVNNGATVPYSKAEIEKLLHMMQEKDQLWIHSDTNAVYFM
ncbi:hypothetical protein CQW23_00905 [Capsicum baccatum]|uniref:Uncharacterized protein n=1 Tax=Capsicum baccatum TaxID=33114 RepID=A0A2G2XM30_CAPBA|nr:hypothetical protein CQW23_00905 [Capsicum baccatum]